MHQAAPANFCWTFFVLMVLVVLCTTAIEPGGEEVADEEACHSSDPLWDTTEQLDMEYPQPQQQHPILDEGSDEMTVAAIQRDIESADEVFGEVLSLNHSDSDEMVDLFIRKEVDIEADQLVQEKQVWMDSLQQHLVRTNQKLSADEAHDIARYLVYELRDKAADFQDMVDLVSYIGYPLGSASTDNQQLVLPNPDQQHLANPQVVQEMERLQSNGFAGSLMALPGSQTLQECLPCNTNKAMATRSNRPKRYRCRFCGEFTRKHICPDEITKGSQIFRKVRSLGSQTNLKSHERKRPTTEDPKSSPSTVGSSKHNVSRANGDLNTESMTTPPPRLESRKRRRSSKAGKSK